MFERKGMKPVEGDHHFGIIVRNEAQFAEVAKR